MSVVEKAIWDGFDLRAWDEGATSPGLSPHLIELPESDWAAWRWSGLRSSGFPAKLVMRLSAPESARAADQVIQAQSDFEESRTQVINLLHKQIKTAAKTEKAELEKALKRLKRGELPSSLPLSLLDMERLKAAREQLDSAMSEYLRLVRIAAQKTSSAIRELADDDLFKEAVIWQNRRAFHTGILPLLRQQTGLGEANSKTRQHEELVASYLQRYCVKSDTIGFFGPVGWARFEPAHFQMSVAPGNDLISKRTVYFEVWCVDAIAELLSRDERIRPWIAPRRVPFARLEGTLLYAQSGKAIRLSPRQAAIFRACDGSRTPKEIAAILKPEFSGGTDFESQVYSDLRSLQAEGVIVWELESRLDVRPERSLRELLQRIEGRGLRAEALALLDRLEALRDEVADAAGNPHKVDAALERLEATFTESTAKAATRFSGETYAGRTLIYEDCQRDVQVTIGYDLIKKFGPPLSLLLDSARWFTYAVAERFREAFERVFDELSQRSDEAGVVDYLTFWTAVMPLLQEGEDSLINKTLKVFQDKWRQVFLHREGLRRVKYTSARLRQQVESLFTAPGPGWSFARYHNADLLIAANGPEAIQRGDYKCILGEMHIAANTLGVPLFMEQFDSPDELQLAAELDMPEPRLVPVVSKDWVGVPSRLLPCLVSPKDFHLQLTTAQHLIPSSKLVTSGSLVIEKIEGNLVVRTRDGNPQFDVIEAFAPMISVNTSNKFNLFEPRAHTPRISIDDLIVGRETWRLRPAQLSFASQKDDALRFLEARRFIKENSIPQFVFVKAPVEVKPFYVDFSSPIYVNIFSKVIRRCISKGKEGELIVISEMLPGVDESWLPDASGQLYTSELRIIAVDQRSPAVPY